MYRGRVEYRHVQRSYLWIFVSAWFALILTGVGLFSDDERKGVGILVAMAAVILFIGAITFWFSRLTFVVSGEAVRCYFGAGTPRRTLAGHTIIGFRKVRNKWYYGWGVRHFPGGWMYNVWGLDAMEFDLADGTKFRIGTDEPEDLLAALSVAIGLRAG